jgi:hypothetical protein
MGITIGAAINLGAVDQVECSRSTAVGRAVTPDHG